MIGAAGLALECPDADGCLANDLPLRRSTPRRDTARPDKSLPSTRVAHHWFASTVAKLPLDKT
jgi:hypothetical protein